jgi:hypothetical protein
MANKRHLNPADIDAVLHGSEVAPGLEPVSRWAAAIRRQAETEISIDTASAQIAALAQTAAAANPGGAGYTALKPSRLERIRRRLVFGSLLSGVGTKVFAASVALATATGGVAATGSLPDAVQDPIATVYNSVGFDFPTSHDDEECEQSKIDCDEDAAQTGEGEAPSNRGDDDSDYVKSDDKDSDDGSDDDQGDDNDDDDNADDDQDNDNDDNADDDQDNDDDDNADDDQDNDDDDNADDDQDDDAADDKPGKGKGRDKGNQGNDEEDQGGGDEE